MGKSNSVYGNEQSSHTVKKAEKSKKKYIKKFGDDSKANYSAEVTENKYIGDLLGVKNIAIGKSEPGTSKGFDLDNGIIVGNIRMGFGHYRISMAMASAANSMGLTPYWMDLNSYPETTGTTDFRSFSGRNTRLAASYSSLAAQTSSGLKRESSGRSLSGR